jgi:transketolase
MEIVELKKKAKDIRIDIIKMIGAAGSGHPGGALSSADLMTVLYFDRLRHNPKDPWWEDRDRAIFSKGHSSALLYACLAESGYFPVEDLLTFRKLGSLLQGHPARNGLPGVEVSTGSLGQGLSVGVGMALGLRQSGKDSRVYVLIGDGECNEGQIWEAAMAAGHYKLDNLCGILDHNHLQIDGFVEEVMGLEPLAEKWRDFGWEIIKVDGHNCEEIISAYKKARTVNGKPSLILAQTVKGKGVSYMENEAIWHGKAPKKEQMEIALKELEKDE